MKLNIIFLTLLLMLISSIGQARVFTAIGVGNSPEAAKKDAMTNAIKLSVGEVIVSKEELNNEQFTQKIVGYSDAYVKKVEVRSQSKLPNGEYEVEVDLDIESQKLEGALKDMKVHIISNAIDSDAMAAALNHFDRRDKNNQTKEEFGELVKALLLEPILEDKELVHVEIIGKLKPLDLPEYNESERFPFRLDIKISPDKSYISNVRKILKESANKPGDMSGAYLFSELILPYIVNNQIENPKPQEKGYWVSYDKRDIIESVLYPFREKIDNKINRLAIDLLDKNGDLIEQLNLSDESRMKLFNIDSKDEVRVFVDSKRLFYPGYGSRFYFYTGEASFFVMLFLTKEEIMKLKDLRVYFTNEDYY